MKLNADHVSHVFLACLYKNGEHTKGGIPVEGIRVTTELHPGRLQEHSGEIVEMLSQLPDTFQASKGGGMSFLEACMDKNGEQWTGLHIRMDELFMLGMAIGRVTCLMPRDLWASIPGGMPYYMVKDTPDDLTDQKS